MIFECGVPGSPVDDMRTVRAPRKGGNILVKGDECAWAITGPNFVTLEMNEMEGRYYHT